MLARVDRIQLAVRDRRAAERTFAGLLGAEAAAEVPGAWLGGRRSMLALGDSQVELCEPAGPGPARERLERRGERLIGWVRLEDHRVGHRGVLRRLITASRAHFRDAMALLCRHS